MSKFKVGDRVTGTRVDQVMHQKEDTIMKIQKDSGRDTYYLCNHSSPWYEDELKLTESKRKEFTFEEVIARIQEGEVYRNIKSEICKVNGNIRLALTSDFPMMPGERATWCMESGGYVLVPQKHGCRLYWVEHQEHGKRYKFRSDSEFKIGEMVICDTKVGRSYGKIVDIETIKLTDEEYKEYKTIRRVK